MTKNFRKAIYGLMFLRSKKRLMITQSDLLNNTDNKTSSVFLHQAHNLLNETWDITLKEIQF